MKNILVLVHKDAGQEARLQAALDLTRALDGHLICLDVVEVPTVAGDFEESYAQSLMIADEQEREEKNRERIEARLANEAFLWYVDRVLGPDAHGGPQGRMLIGVPVNP